MEYYLKKSNFFFFWCTAIISLLFMWLLNLQTDFEGILTKNILIFLVTQKKSELSSATL